MKRIIKFRVFDLLLKKFVNVPFYSFENESYIHQQFTGFLDVEKNEIYEGDLVISIARANGHVSFSGINGIVEFDEAGFWCLRFKENGYFIVDFRNLKIVGNILEDLD